MPRHVSRDHENAVNEGLKRPEPIDLKRVDAQQARRILDRIVGYQLSPLLWKKVCKGLSAGRVQSVAVRLICEREEEIASFVPEEYWTLAAVYKAEDGTALKAELAKVNGKKPSLPPGKRPKSFRRLSNGKKTALRRMRIA